MLAQSARGVECRGFSLDEQRVVLRLRSADSTAPPLSSDCLLEPESVDGSSTIATFAASPRSYTGTFRTVLLPPELEYLGDGDVVALEPSRGVLRVLYRRNSPSNSLLVTERCNHYCLMCSQPPKNIDDSFIYSELDEAIPLISNDTREIGITGGEPTLGGDRFLNLVRSMKTYLPRTALHVLSNGRRFVDPSFAKALAGISHPDFMIGIPIYADYAALHDYVVQSDGAFDETIRGILNLKAQGIRVEVRIVVLKQNSDRLVQLAEFLARNLTFIDHVTFMALEVTGFARANLELIWIDPHDYRIALTEAARTTEAAGIRTSLYNHQLCTVEREVWHLARKSISDWKQEYLPTCTACSIKDQCAGFFATGRTRHSAYITAQ